MHLIHIVGLRPVICLKSGVKLQANASGGYDLIQPDVVVTENQAKLEVTVGESNNSFDSLFTVTTKDGGTATRTYQLNGTTTNIRNTSDLAVGTHTLTCTATYNGVTDSAYMTIVVKSAVPEEDTLLASKVGNGSVTFEVPSGVNVLKISAYDGNGFDGDGNYIVSYYAQQLVKGTSAEWLDTIYVAVTPGKSYELQMSGSSAGGVIVYYSQSINEQTPTYDLDAPVVTFVQYDPLNNGSVGTEVTINYDGELNYDECFYRLDIEKSDVVSNDE